MPECAIGTTKLQIEIPLLLIFFALSLSDSVSNNLIIYRTCYVTLGYNQSECVLLGSKHPDNQTAQLEKTVEPYATVIGMVNSLTTALVSTVTCLFIGPWSDRFGRKPVLVLPVTGFLISYILMAVFGALDASPWYFIACFAPVLCTGGKFPYLAVLFCYVTDMTNEESRGLRMGVIEAVITIGIMLGTVSSSYILSVTNYSSVFIISAFCCFLNLIYTIVLLPESLATTVTGGDNEGRFKGLFHLGNIVDMVKTTVKKRENHQRFVLLSCFVMFTLFMVQVNGDGAVVNYFLRAKFNWSLERCTLYSGILNISWILGAVIGVYFLNKILKVPETVMILIASISMFLSAITTGVAFNDWMVYAAAFPRSMGSVLGPMISSFFSKIVPHDEVGKLFALMVATQALFSMTGPPIYTGIYNLTLATNSAIFNFVSAGIYLIEAIVAFAIIMVTPIRRHQTLVNEENEGQSSSEET